MFCFKSSARSGQKIYHIIARNANSKARVTEIDLKDFPQEADPEDLSNDNRFLRSSIERETTPKYLNSTRDRELFTIKRPFIDILVPYTKRSFCNVVYGFSTTKCIIDGPSLALMQTFVELNIFQSNKAFQNSGIEGRFRLAKAFMVNETYDESGLTFSNVLRNLASRDNVIDNVLDVRNQFGGDLVAMIIDNTETCGLSYTGYPVSKFFAFAVVHWECATGYYSFVHELAHHLGANHDRLSEACPKEQCCKKGCYNYGYKDPQQRFRTIMSYDCLIPGGCPRVQIFSQPLFPYFEERTEYVAGDAYNDNAKRIRVSWDTVAEYLAEVTPILIEGDPLGNKRLPKIDPCGNGVCEPHLGEDCWECPADCIGGVYKGTYCGDGICQYKENCVNCPKDCPSRVDKERPELNFCCAGGMLSRSIQSTGTGLLNFTAGCRNTNCRWNTSCDQTRLMVEWSPEDPILTYCCGNGKCELGETSVTCPTDCEGLIHRLPERCMTNGRRCVDISPDPCCGYCNKDTRQCAAKENITAADRTMVGFTEPIEAPRESPDPPS